MGQAGFKAENVDATAHVTVKPQNGGFKITKSHIICEARVPGIDQATFVQHGETAKASCPVSQALVGTQTTLEAKLARQMTRGQQKRDRRVVRMVAQMDAEPFGNCSWHGECQEACPKRVSIDVIALMNREYLRASMTRSPDDGAFRTVPGTFQFGVRLSIGHAAQDADVEAKR